MPKIDWAPGLGRRGRPLRRVLGMGQRQGLIVLSGIAAVMVLLALIAAAGGFNDDPPHPDRNASPPGSANANPDDPAAAGPAGDAKGSAAAAAVLQASVQHYTDLFTTGQKIVGTTRYADMAAYGKAYTDPKSPAAAFAKYRITTNPESDTTYTDAMDKATAAYSGNAKALNKWMSDMATAKSDLGDWVATAAQFQRGTAGKEALDAAAAKVTQDLATAQADAAAVGG